MVCLLRNIIQDEAKKFTEAVNQELPEGMELEFEGFFERGFFVTKKRYALIQEGKVKGLELVRRDWAPVQENARKGIASYPGRRITQKGNKNSARCYPGY